MGHMDEEDLQGVLSELGSEIESLKTEWWKCREYIKELHKLIDDYQECLYIYADENSWARCSGVGGRDLFIRNYDEDVRQGVVNGFTLARRILIRNKKVFVHGA